MSAQPSILSQRSVTALIFLTSPQPLWDRGKNLVPVLPVERLRRVSSKARTDPRPLQLTPRSCQGPTQVHLDRLSRQMVSTLSETLTKYTREARCTSGTH